MEQRPAGTEKPTVAVVCIPTFRRPDWLERTLRSVLAQEAPFGFAVVLVDNDAAAEGLARARQILAPAKVPHLLLTEAQQGNCFAINRAFTEAQAAFPSSEFFLMIDDDEEAEPGWLTAMVACSTDHEADIVGGPVLRRFEHPVPASVASHPLFFSIDGVSRPVDQIHGSGNCLIRRRVFSRMAQPPFDTRFNFLGGGDMEFFTRCRLAGFKTWWCQEAVVHEYVPAERTRMKFLTRRSLRTGSINYMVDRSHMPMALAWAKNAASLGMGVGRSLATLVRTRSWLLASHAMLLPLGRIMAGLGILPQPYKASN